MQRVAAVVIALLLLSLSASADQLDAGKAALKAGNVDGAIQLFERAVAQKPTAEAHFWLGRAYGQAAMKASMLKQASLAKKTKAAFERAVQLDPNHLEARMGLVDYYTMAPGFMGGSNEKAMEMAAEIKKRDNLLGHRAFARIYDRQKKPELVKKEMIEAVREQPNSAAAHYFLGNVWANEKNYPAALHEYEYAIKLDASYMRAWFRVGWLAALTNSNHARGEEALRKYLTYTPGVDEPALASAWYYLGQLYEKQGKKGEARNSYLQAQKLAPESKDVQEALKRVS